MFSTVAPGRVLFFLAFFLLVMGWGGFPWRLRGSRPGSAAARAGRQGCVPRAGQAVLVTRWLDRAGGAPGLARGAPAVFHTRLERMGSAHAVIVESLVRSPSSPSIAMSTHDNVIGRVAMLAIDPGLCISGPPTAREEIQHKYIPSLNAVGDPRSCLTLVVLRPVPPRTVGELHGGLLWRLVRVFE